MIESSQYTYTDRLHLIISASQKMMSNVHLAGDTGDMYGGFGREDVAPALDTADLEFDSGFQVMTHMILTSKPPTPD